MDYAEYQLLADIDDELTALAENIARLQLIVEEMRFPCSHRNPRG